jgi:hypothetical protein
MIGLLVGLWLLLDLGAVAAVVLTRRWCERRGPASTTEPFAGLSGYADLTRGAGTPQRERLARRG